MASVRKRTWRSGGQDKTAWVVDYFDQQGKRRHKQFSRKKEADLFLVTARGQVVAGTYTADSASPTVSTSCTKTITGNHSSCKPSIGRW